MSNQADIEIITDTGDSPSAAFRGDMEELLKGLFERRPWPNIRSANAWVRIKANSETRRRF